MLKYATAVVLIGYLMTADGANVSGGGGGGGGNYYRGGGGGNMRSVAPPVQAKTSTAHTTAKAAKISSHAHNTTDPGNSTSASWVAATAAIGVVQKGFSYKNTATQVVDAIKKGYSYFNTRPAIEAPATGTAVATGRRPRRRRPSTLTAAAAGVGSAVAGMYTDYNPPDPPPQSLRDETPAPIQNHPEWDDETESWFRFVNVPAGSSAAAAA